MPEDLADVMARVAETLHEQRSTEETLEAIVHGVRATVPGVQHVGISVARKDSIQTMAATDELVYRIDAIQFELREGPCVDSLLGRTRTVANDIVGDGRWPSFGPKAVELGIRSQFGVDLFAEAGSVGGLNLYAGEIDVFDDDAVHVATLFANHAAHALGKSMREEQLQEALRSRRQIGQAIGIVMERYRVDEQRAFDYLARVSQHGNIKLRDVAAQLVEQGNGLRQQRPGVPDATDAGRS
ncbi:GAF and ANTAR domain-containing protein [Desertihabitans brevis]|nr:ANTAR domain-containing protein [Desertihabitans brevis]